MMENRIFTLCGMITWVVFLRMFWNFISSLPVKRGGSLSFLVGTISNVLVMEICWTDVGSGGYILVSCAHSNTSLICSVFHSYLPKAHLFNVRYLFVSKHHTQIVMSHICVVFNRRKMYLPICSKVQLCISREGIYSTNLYWHWQSKTEASKLKTVIIISQTSNQFATMQ